MNGDEKVLIMCEIEQKDAIAFAPSAAFAFCGSVKRSASLLVRVILFRCV